MKTITEFKRWLEDIKDNNQEDEQLDFVWELMKSPFVDFHYELIKDFSLKESFRSHLAHRFNEHGAAAEDLLIFVLDNNKDVHYHAEVIYLLGKMNGKHHEKILQYARDFTNSEDDYTRDRAIIVLGWIGSIEDLDILEDHLMTDNNTSCRAWSASGMMQLWLKKEDDKIKQKSFEIFKSALVQEEDHFVISTILTAIRVMGKTRLGISQLALDELDIEKIALAKPKALRFLQKHTA